MGMHLKPYLSFESENQNSISSFAYIKDEDHAHMKIMAWSSSWNSGHFSRDKSHTKIKEMQNAAPISIKTKWKKNGPPEWDLTSKREKKKRSQPRPRLELTTSCLEGWALTLTHYTIVIKRIVLWLETTTVLISKLKTKMKSLSNQNSWFDPLYMLI